MPTNHLESEEEKKTPGFYFGREHLAGDYN